MTARLDAAATVTSPAVSAAADPTHEAGVIFRVAHSTAGTVNACAAPIPKNARGCHWRMLSIGANVDWGWLLDTDGVGGADTAPTLVYGQLSATGTGHLAAQPTLLDGVPEHVYCPPNARGVIFVSSSAATAPNSFTASKSGAKTGGNGLGTGAGLI
jgi:hypothetical protein